MLFIFKDNSKTTRQELTEDELCKYANQAYRDHLKMKKENTGANLQYKSQEALIAANRRTDRVQVAEQGVKIKVGFEAATNAVEKKDEEDEDEEEIEIEALF